MYKINAMIEGLVPVLMSKYPMPDRQGAQTATYEGMDDAQVALEKKAFKDDKGMYIPADNLRMMLIGNQFRTGAAKILGSTIEKQKGKLYTDLCKACVWTVGPDDPLKVYFKPDRKTWDDTDLRSFITSKGGRDVVERPQINTPWTLEFEVHVTTDQLKIGKVKELFEVAGLRCGVGAYGPTFGRFQVAKWESAK